MRCGAMSVLLAMGCASGLAADQDASTIPGCGLSCDGPISGQGGQGGQANCGNAMLDYGEACDTGISPGEPGACPSSCDDGDSCTIDTVTGLACQTRCSHVTISVCKNDDGCCAAGCTGENDNDC